MIKKKVHYNKSKNTLNGETCIVLKSWDLIRIVDRACFTLTPIFCMECMCDGTLFVLSYVNSIMTTRVSYISYFFMQKKRYPLPDAKSAFQLQPTVHDSCGNTISDNTMLAVIHNALWKCYERLFPIEPNNAGTYRHARIWITLEAKVHSTSSRT